MDTNADPAAIAATKRAAVADGDGTFHVLERFSASTGISMTKVRATLIPVGGGGGGEHNGNCVLSAVQDETLVYAAQDFGYTNCALFHL